jgi:hypothetical protein
MWAKVGSEWVMDSKNVLFFALMVCCVSAFFFGLASTKVLEAAAPAAEEETIAGMVVKSDQGIVIEADDGDYLVKGAKSQEVAKMAGKLVEVTGIISETPKGDVIDVKSVEEIQE